MDAEQTCRHASSPYGWASVAAARSLLVTGRRPMRLHRSIMPRLLKVVDAFLLIVRCPRAANAILKLFFKTQLQVFTRVNSCRVGITRTDCNFLTSYASPQSAVLRHRYDVLLTVSRPADGPPHDVRSSVKTITSSVVFDRFSPGSCTSADYLMSMCALVGYDNIMDCIGAMNPRLLGKTEDGSAYTKGIGLMICHHVK